ncbi:hypothetical protein PV11_01982 [Exophiala sideris]|uniref:Uncharacterized protein n=1 Tax=Exophiala sideris TaxID=1016849 RepID=A0A0D1ZHQ5_9EURO|nr:hypothetical protein PV11_01982 [Exophiala sideris]
MDAALKAALDEVSAPNRQLPGEASDEESASQESYTEVGLGQVISPGRRQRPRTPGRRADRNTPQGTASPGSDHSETLADLGLHEHPNFDDKLSQHIPDLNQASTSSVDVPAVDSPEANEMSIDQLLSQVVGTPSNFATDDLASAPNLQDHNEAGLQSGPKEQDMLSPMTREQRRHGDTQLDQRQGEEKQHVQNKPEQQGEEDLKLEERLDKLLAENATLKMEKDFIVKEANTLHEKNAGLLQDLSKSQKDLSIARNDMARRSAHKEELLKKAENALEESQESAEPLVIAQQRVRHLEKEKSDLEEMIILANTAFREAKQMHTQYESRIAELQEQVDSLTAWKDNIPQELRTCQKECERLKAELKRCVERMEKVRSAQHVFDLEQMDFHDRCLPVLLDQISINDFRLPLKPSAAEVTPLGEYMASPIDSAPSNRQSMASGVDTPVRHVPPTGIALSNKPRPQSCPVPAKFSPLLDDSSEIALDPTDPTIQSTSIEFRDAQRPGAPNDNSSEVSHRSPRHQSDSGSPGPGEIQGFAGLGPKPSLGENKGSVALLKSSVQSASVPARLLQSLTDSEGVRSPAHSPQRLDRVLETGVWPTHVENPDSNESFRSPGVSPLLVDTAKTTVVGSSSAVDSPQSPGLRKRLSVSPQHSPQNSGFNAAFEDGTASPPSLSGEGNELVSKTPRGAPTRHAGITPPQTTKGHPLARSDNLIPNLPRHGRLQPSRTHSLTHERPAMIMVDSRRGRPQSWHSLANRSISPQRSANSDYDSDGEQVGIASPTAPLAPENGSNGDYQQKTPTCSNEMPPMSPSARTATTSHGNASEPSSSGSLDAFGAFSPLGRQVSASMSQASTNVGSLFEPMNGGSDRGTIATSVSDADSVAEKLLADQSELVINEVAELSEALAVEGTQSPRDSEIEVVPARESMIVLEAGSRPDTSDAEDAEALNAEDGTEDHDEPGKGNLTPSVEELPYFPTALDRTDFRKRKFDMYHLKSFQVWHSPPPNDEPEVRKRRSGTSMLTALLFCALVLSSGLLTVWYTGPWSIQTVCQHFTSVSSTLCPTVSITEQPLLPALSAVEEPSHILAIPEVPLADTVTMSALEAIPPMHLSSYTQQMADHGPPGSAKEGMSIPTAPSSVYKGQPGRTGPAPALPIVIQFEPSRTRKASPSTPNGSSYVEDSKPCAPPSFLTRTVTVAIPRACPHSNPFIPSSISTRPRTLDRPCADPYPRAVEEIRIDLPESTTVHAGPQYMHFTDADKSDVNSFSHATRAYPGSGHLDFVPSLRRWIDQIRFDVTVQIIKANGGYSW